jgi:acyl-CoA thioester hydrolase
MGRDYMVAQRRGSMSVEQNIRYRRELLAGDAVYVESWLSEVADKRVILNHAMYNQVTGALSAEMKIVAIHVDLDKRKACPFPAEVRRTLDDWVVRD